MIRFIVFLFIEIIGLTANPISAQNMKLQITVEDKEFSATLNDSDAARELIKMLPMTVTMSEHNGNEKYYNLPKKLPGRAANPGIIKVGELMVWSSDTLVLFYAGNFTSYSYIRLGRVDNPSGLSEALGRGSVKVSFGFAKQSDKKENSKEK
nr:cyclophilin-like fold protein [uncultured Bacteroides sp.]